MSPQTVDAAVRNERVGWNFLEAIARTFNTPVTDLIFDPVRYYLNPDVTDKDGKTPVESELSVACDRNFNREGAFVFHPEQTFVSVLAHIGETEKAEDWVYTVLEQLRPRPSTRQHRLLLANYGAGKTFSTWKLALELAERFPDRPESGVATASTAEASENKTVVPLIFPLREIAPASKDSPWEQIIAYFHKWFEDLNFDGSLSYPDIPIEYDVLLILDALDELPANRQKTLEIFESIRMAAMAFPRLSLLVTVRTAMFPSGTHELDKVFPEFARARLYPWDDSHWQALLKKCPTDFFSKGWKTFHDEVATRVDKDLITRPLWCRLIIECRAHLPSGGIKDTASLFALYVDKFFEEPGQKVRETASLPDRDFLIRAMELLGAERAVLRGGTGASALVTELALGQLLAQEFPGAEDTQWNEVLRDAARTRSLFHCEPISSVAGYGYHFGHNSFEEYFQACHLARFIDLPQFSALGGIKSLNRLLGVVKAAKGSGDLRTFCRGVLQRGSTAERGSTAAALSKLMCKEPEAVFGKWLDAIKVRQFLLDLWINHSSALGRADFKDFRLQGLRLAGKDLSGCDFTRADLSHADLGSNLSGANFTDAFGIHTDFTDAVFTIPAIWTRAQLTEPIGLPKTG